MSVNEVEIKTVNPFDTAPSDFLETLKRRFMNRGQLLDWIKDALTEDLDYGRIHFIAKSKCNLGKACKDDRHWSKPVLFKAGSEKILGLLGVTVCYPDFDLYERAITAGVGLQMVMLKCQLMDSAGRVLSEGLGARVFGQDNGDINKSLKMCAKSAQIDATLRLAGLSEVFTQDLDDMPPPDEEAVKANSQQVKRLKARMAGYELDEARVLKYAKSKYGIEKLDELTFEQYRELDARLESFAEKMTEERRNQVISKDEYNRLTSFLLQSRLNLNEVLAHFKIMTLKDLKNEHLKEAWTMANDQFLAKQKAEYDPLTEEEKVKRALAMERQYVEAERKAGRDPTWGT